MTFSILAQDAGTGTLGAAAATGSLCVGGWVLRGNAGAGLSASQGAAPSTLWGDGAQARLRAGATAAEIVADLTGADRGRDWRQLAVLDARGGTASHTGTRNGDWKGALAGSGLVVTGNLLAGPKVLEALRAGFLDAPGAIAERLLAALDTAAAAGGDTRGLQSAALLVLAPDAPPLSLRIDWSKAPLTDLRTLFGRSQSGEYAAWLPCVPTPRDPERRPE